MSRIIDNEKRKMYEILNKDLINLNDLCFASAYFNIGGFNLIKETIKNKKLKFLIGRPPDESIAFDEKIIKEIEEHEDDSNYYKLLKEAIDYFKSNLVEIKKGEGSFFHGKAYIGINPSLDNPEYGIGIVGSSNFTFAGLKTNMELNVENTDREVLKELSTWFLNRWDKADDYKNEFIKVLENYTVTHLPFEIVSKALYETYKNDLELAQKIKMIDLKIFQKVSVLEATRILDNYGGVVIADSTGLGKTRTMIALAQEARMDGKKALLIAPKSVISTTWKKEMEETDTNIEYVNSEYISQNPEKFTNKYKDKYNFIIIDEAHYFKSSATKRYKALRELILLNNAEVVLGTATPINTSLMDLYNLISLFANDDSIRDITDMSLKGYFSSNQKALLNGKNFDMTPVLERFVVRHSRRFAMQIDSDSKFPKRIIDKDPLDKYIPDIDYEDLNKKLEDLNFVQYDFSVDKLSDFTLPSGAPVSILSDKNKKDNLKKLIKTIVKLNIFKRLESSKTAFKYTMKNILDYLNKAIEMANMGYFLPSSIADSPFFDYSSDDKDLEDIEDNIKNVFNDMDLKDKCKLADNERDYFIKCCKEDIKSIDNILSGLSGNDEKLDHFIKRIKKIINNIEKPNGIVIFTQYKDTAKYLYEEIKNIKINNYLTTGSVCYDNGKTSNTSDIVNKFQECGGIIVSTDVLSEGQNLQNAQYMVNYDFPWNPVVLIQRSGRIDRLMSPYKNVFLINILPDNSNPEDPKSLEHFIRLIKRLYTRITGIKNTIGIDSPILDDDTEPKDFGNIQKLIADGNSDILDTLSKSLEQFDSDPREKLLDIINEKGKDWIKKLPNGIGSYKIYNRNGIFALFKDNNSNYYWRLLFDDNKEIIKDPSQIVSILLKDYENDTDGKYINYELIVDKLKKLKEQTINEIKTNKRNQNIGKIIHNLTNKDKFIIKKLNEFDESLSLLYRNIANEQLTNSLYEHINSDDFYNMAKELIEKYSNENSSEEIIETPEDIKMTRICWCLLRRDEIL